MESARIAVRLTPRAARDELQGIVHRETARAPSGADVGATDAVLRVRVTAPPVDGRANGALTALLADVLGVPKHDVRVVAGLSSRDKVVAIDSLSTADVWARLRRSLHETGEETR